MTAADYWRSGKGLQNITPRGKPWPEGEDFGPWLVRLIGPGVVLDFGCGPGRLAALFPACRYVGVDLCPEALDLARQRLPLHAFLPADDPLPRADVTLAHTVLLHVPDDELPATVARFKSERVLVSEVMGRGWRREGLPPVFNRDPGDYQAAFAAEGYQLLTALERPYPHYPDTSLTILDFWR